MQARQSPAFFTNEIEDRPLDPDRLAEIALQYTLDPQRVANRKRLIEMVFLVQIGDHRPILILSRQRQGRIGNSCCNPKIKISTKKGSAGSRRYGEAGTRSFSDLLREVPC